MLHQGRLFYNTKSPTEKLPRSGYSIVESDQRFIYFPRSG
jgi:hypothetical protein